LLNLAIQSTNIPEDVVGELWSAHFMQKSAYECFGLRVGMNSNIQSSALSIPPSTGSIAGEPLIGTVIDRGTG